MQPDTSRRCCALGRLRATELAVVASYLTVREVEAGRLLSRGLRRALDSDLVWATLARERLAAPRGGESCASSHFFPTVHGSWKPQLLDSGLLRLIARTEGRRAVAPVAGVESAEAPAAAAMPCGVCQWVPLVSIDGPVALARLRFNPAIRAFADATCPPGSHGAGPAAQRCRSIGFVLAEPDAAAAASLVGAVHAQLHRFLNLHLAPDATAAAVSQLLPPSDPSSLGNGRGPTLSVFSYFSKLMLSDDDNETESERLLVTFLTDTTTATQAASPPIHGNNNNTSSNSFAKLLELTLATCATVVFLADSTASMHTALSRSLHVHQTGSSSSSNTTHLQPVARAPYSTDRNTPTLVFAGLSARIDVAAVVACVPAALASHLTQRSSSLGECRVGDGTLFLLGKPFCVPAWVNPAVAVHVPLSVVVRMAQSFVEADTTDATTIAAAAGGPALLAPPPTAGPFHPLWSPAVVAFLCSAHERQALQFYTRALDTDFDDMTRAGANNSGSMDEGRHTPSHLLRVPAEPSQLVEVHHQHFYAALRRMCMALDPVCGADSALGLKALEGLKQGISEKFRDVWVENREISRAYCSAVFDALFAPLVATYLVGADPPGFQQKRGLQRFFIAIQANVHAYTHASKGHRRFDVLSERVLDAIIPQLLAYCDAHPLHPHFRRADADAVAKELRAACHALMNDFARQVDGEIGQLQRVTAVYTASLGSAWAASLQTTAMAFLRGEEAAADAWCYACAARTGFLLHGQRQAPPRHRRPFTTRSSDHSDRSDRSDRSALSASHPTAADDGAASDTADLSNSATDMDAWDGGASDGEDHQRVTAERATVHATARAAEEELRAAAQRLASNLRGAETAAFAVVAHAGAGGTQRPPSKAKRLLQAIHLKIRSW